MTRIVRHGTNNEYTNYGCRCEHCTHAAAVWQTDYQAERAVALGPCSVDNCELGQYAKGLCNGHYTRLRRTGRVDAERPLNTSTVRDGELRCNTCREWLPDTEFHRSRYETHRRGRHASCRVCATELRREHRQRMTDEQREAVNARQRELRRRKKVA